MNAKQLQNLILAREDIVWYARNVLCVEPYDYQEEIMRAIQNNPKVVWRAGHGVGKTSTSAWTINWFFDVHQNSRVITTASSWRQVSKVLWPEIHKWRRKAKLKVIGANNYESLNFELRRNNSIATGEASDEPEKMEGFHEDNLLYVVDEAKTVPKATFEAIEGALTTENAKMLVISTPPPTMSGYFYEACVGKRVGFRTFHTSAYDSANVDRKWIKAREKEWGKDSPVFQNRVLGEFAESSDDTLIPLKWIDACTEKKVEMGGIYMGVDVARHGDDSSVICIRSGDKVIELKKYKQLDVMEFTGRVKRLIDQYSPMMVNIDSIGIGSGVVDRLSEMGYNVNEVNVGESPLNPDDFANKRAEMFWYLRELFREGRISIPEDEELVGQLSNIKYDYNSKGKTLIEAKKDMKRRGLKSPDTADALALAFYKPVKNEKVEVTVI